MKKIRLALVFGGRSPEHEVSVVSAVQAYRNLDKKKYEVLAIYVDKSGDFYHNQKFLDIRNYQDIQGLILSSHKVHFGRKSRQGGLFREGLWEKFIPFDIAFPLFHGPFGEDGSIQGVFEIYQIPYVGFNVLSSSVCFDKVLTKQLFVALNIPTAPFTSVTRISWNRDSKKCVSDIKRLIHFPLFVKPATGGSTIGVNIAKDEDSLRFGLEVALTYSDKAIIEKAFKRPQEVNCSVLGYEKVLISVCEMPVRSGETLSYEDKYLRGQGKGSKGAGMASLSRLIPAPISSKLTRSIQETTRKVFQVLDGCGVARIDFFVDPKTDRFWINEVNSPPGSLSFYLWEKTGKGLKYQKLLDIMIMAGLKRAENQKLTHYTFQSPLLSQMATASQTGTKP